MCCFGNEIPFYEILAVLFEEKRNRHQMVTYISKPQKLQHKVEFLSLLHFGKQSKLQYWKMNGKKFQRFDISDFYKTIKNAGDKEITEEEIER